MAIGSSGLEPGEPFLSLPNPCRYGPDDAHWSPWRRTGRKDDNPPLPRKLEVEHRHLCGYSGNQTNALTSIATTDVKGEVELAGSHKPEPYLSLSVGPPASLALSHLSGDEEYKNWTVCFNYL